MSPFTPESSKTGDQLQQFRTIVAQPEYAYKSPEELRYEDYGAGIKGKAGARLLGPSHPNNTPASGAAKPGMSPLGAPRSPTAPVARPACISRPTAFGNCGG